MKSLETNMKKQSHRNPGRPVKNVVKPINAPADRIAKVIMSVPSQKSKSKR